MGPRCLQKNIHDGQEHQKLHSKAGYIDARPHIRRLDQSPLATHGRTIHWVTSRHTPSLRLRPLYPRKRTLVCVAAMSALCQKRTFASQQKAVLFDHLVGVAHTNRGQLHPETPALASGSRRNRPPGGHRRIPDDGPSVPREAVLRIIPENPPAVSVGRRAASGRQWR